MTHCTERTLVDAHFAGTIAPDDEHVMRDHLVACERCRARYRKRQLLAKMDPDAPSAEDRIGRALGLVAPAGARQEEARVRPLFPPKLAPALGVILAVAALTFLVVRPREGDGFHSRGSLTMKEEPITVLQIQEDRAVQTGGSLRRDDELAFTYRNVDGKPYLMIFGVDEAGRVYWFHPGWTDEREDPKAAKIPTDRGQHELREAVRHRFTGQRLEIHALFLDAPLGVREVERALAERRTVDGGTDHVVSFTMAP